MVMSLLFEITARDGSENNHSGGGLFLSRLSLFFCGNSKICSFHLFDKKLPRLGDLRRCLKRWPHNAHGTEGKKIHGCSVHSKATVQSRSSFLITPPRRAGQGCTGPSRGTAGRPALGAACVSLQS